MTSNLRLSTVRLAKTASPQFRTALVSLLGEAKVGADFGPYDGSLPSKITKREVQKYFREPGSYEKVILTQGGFGVARNADEGDLAYVSTSDVLKGKKAFAEWAKKRGAVAQAFQAAVKAGSGPIWDIIVKESDDSDMGLGHVRGGLDAQLKLEMGRIRKLDSNNPGTLGEGMRMAPIISLIGREIGVGGLTDPGNPNLGAAIYAAIHSTDGNAFLMNGNWTAPAIQRWDLVEQAIKQGSKTALVALKNMGIILADKPAPGQIMDTSVQKNQALVRWTKKFVDDAFNDASRMESDLFKSVKANVDMVDGIINRAKADTSVVADIEALEDVARPLRQLLQRLSKV